MAAAAEVPSTAASAPADGEADSNPNRLPIDTPEQRATVMEMLFRSHPLALAKAVSCEERERKGQTSGSLTYGEVSHASWEKIVEKVRSMGKLPEEGGVFVDLGTGSGKGVFASCLVHRWEVCRGVEILEGLYELSIEVQDRWMRDILPRIPEVEHTKIELVKGDFREFDFSNASLVLACSTCFSDELMANVADVLSDCAPGTIAVTLTTQIPSVKWKVIDETSYKMSWGTATVYTHEKV